MRESIALRGILMIYLSCVGSTTGGGAHNGAARFCRLDSAVCCIAGTKGQDVTSRLGKDETHKKEGAEKNQSYHTEFSVPN